MLLKHGVRVGVDRQGVSVHSRLGVHRVQRQLPAVLDLGQGPAGVERARRPVETTLRPTQEPGVQVSSIDDFENFPATARS